MSFVDHLEELRWHIIRAVLSILVCAIVVFIYHAWVFDVIIMGPTRQSFVSYEAFCRLSGWLGLSTKEGSGLCLQAPHISMQTTETTGQFLSTINIAFVAGLILAFPYIFWELWRFVKPALKPKEVKGTRFVIFWISFFFFLGALFGYLVLAPFTFSFLLNFNISANPDTIKTIPTISDYIENLTTIILGVGLAFEMPVLAYALTRIGIITPSFLKRSRKYAIVVILVIAAFITPSPDWYSQTIVFIPLMLLYEFGVLVSKRAYKALEKRDQEEWS